MRFFQRRQSFSGWPGPSPGREATTNPTCIIDRHGPSGMQVGLVVACGHPDIVRATPP